MGRGPGQRPHEHAEDALRPLANLKEGPVKGRERSWLGIEVSEENIMYKKGLFLMTVLCGFWLCLSRVVVVGFITIVIIVVVMLFISFPLLFIFGFGTSIFMCYCYYLCFCC